MLCVMNRHNNCSCRACVACSESFKTMIEPTMPQAKAHTGHKHHSVPVHVKAFIDAHLATAKDIQSRYGIPAGLVIAQSALESSWGRAVVGNAYFGMKGHAPTGATTTFTTHENVNGQNVQTQGTFRAYTGYDDAAEDWARWIRGQSALQQGCYTQSTASRCATMLAQRGYGTDPRYAAKLHAIISTYKLDQYDAKAQQ